MKRRERYRNREGGYWVAAADPDVADHAKTGQIPLKGFGHTALMSDGATRLVSPFGQTNWHGLLAAVLNSGPAAVIKHVRSIEAADAQGERWPRFKVSDDATIAVIGALRNRGVPARWDRLEARGLGLGAAQKSSRLALVISAIQAT